jgi:hypothetical protein
MFVNATMSSRQQLGTALTEDRPVLLTYRGVHREIWCVPYGWHAWQPLQLGWVTRGRGLMQGDFTVPAQMALCDSQLLQWGGWWAFNSGKDPVDTRHHLWSCCGRNPCFSWATWLLTWEVWSGSGKQSPSGWLAQALWFPNTIILLREQTQQCGNFITAEGGAWRSYLKWCWLQAS